MKEASLEASCHAAEFVRVFCAAAGGVGEGEGGAEGDDVKWYSNVFVWGEAASMRMMKLVAICEWVRPF
jgi:hypothetical protein